MQPKVYLSVNTTMFDRKLSMSTMQGMYQHANLPCSVARSVRSSLNPPTRERTQSAQDIAHNLLLPFKIHLPFAGFLTSVTVPPGVLQNAPKTLFFAPLGFSSVYPLEMFQKLRGNLQMESNQGDTDILSKSVLY